jgi:hypothetical protein
MRVLGDILIVAAGVLIGILAAEATIMWLFLTFGYK